MTPSFKLFTAGLLATTVLTGPSVVLAQAPAAGSPPPAATEPGTVEEIVVRGRFIPNEKRITSEIANVITAEDIKRAGDSDIAGALTRVTGLSLVGDGYVYVRGLGERYSAALLDGSSLPSPEPLRRIVSLDLFPTSLLAGSLVQKTYSVEYPAEFGGGLIALRTLAVPRAPYLTMSTSVGYNSEATFQRGSFADYGDNNWTGFRDASAVKFPSVLHDNPTLAGITVEQRQVAARSLRNAWSFDRETLGPDTGLRLNAGTRFDIGDMRAGFVGLIDYGSSFKIRDGIRRNYSISTAGLQRDEDLSPEGCESINKAVSAASCGVFRTNWDVRLNLLGTAGLEINEDNSVKFTTLLLRKTVQEARSEKGDFNSVQGSILNRLSSTYIEQQVWTNQLTGEHHLLLSGDLNELELDWRAAYAKANRDTPYRREFTYIADSLGRARWDLAQGRNATIFSALEDENIEFGADGKLTGKLFGNEATFKFGGVTIDKDRDFLQRRYEFRLQQNLACGALPEATLRAVPEIILSPDNIGSVCGFTIGNAADNADQFKAKIGIDALYGSVEYQVLPDFRWTLGLRGERSNQSIATFKLREGMAIGAKVTLRRDRMYEFIDRLITIALPRVRDFRGLNGKSFDGNGNYAMGLKEQIVFPEIDYDKVDQVRGMDIIICTTAKTDAEARSLLRAFDFPFVN